MSNPNMPPNPNPNQLTPEREAALAELTPLRERLTEPAFTDIDALRQVYAQAEEDARAERVKQLEEDFIRQGVGDIDTHVQQALALPENKERIGIDASEHLILSKQQELEALVDELTRDLDPQDPLYADQRFLMHEAVMNAVQMSDDVWYGDKDAKGYDKNNGVGSVLSDDLNQPGPLPRTILPRHQSPGPNPPVGAPLAPLPISVNPPNPNIAPAPETLQDRVDRLRREVEGARRAKRVSSVNRQRSAYSGRDVADEAHEKNLGMYTTSLREYLEALKELLEDAGQDDATIRAEILKATNEFEEDETIEEKKILVKEAGRLGEALQWYGQLGRVKKIALGLGVSALLAAGGAGIAAAGGGAAVLGGAAAVLSILRAARVYALTLSRQYAPDDSRPDELTVGKHIDFDDLMDACEAYVEKNTKDRIETADKMHKRAIAVGIGSLALGSLAEHALPFAEQMFFSVKQAVPDLGIADKIGSAYSDWTGGGSSDGHRLDGGVANGDNTTSIMETKLPSVTEQLHDAVAGNEKLSGLIEQHTGPNGEIKIPVEDGDGFERIGNRYDLTDAQQNKLEEIMAQHQNSGHSQTYKVNGDLRLNKADGFLHLSPQEALAIVNAK